MDTNAHGFLGARASARLDVAVPDGSNSPGTTLDADIEAPSPLRFARALQVESRLVARLCAQLWREAQSVAREQLRQRMLSFQFNHG